MKCVVQKENEKLKEENQELKEEIELLQLKIRELLQSFGKDINCEQQEKKT